MSQELFPERSFVELPGPDRIAFGELLAIDLGTRTNPFTHGLHRYPAKFIPQIPRWAIREFTRPGDVVLDPFCGSGTTLVESLVSGRKGIGVELDGLACLIARAKLAELSPVRLATLTETVLANATRMPRGDLVVPMQGVKDFSHWFSFDAWGQLQSLKNSILSTVQNDAERTFFLVLFSSILREVSNADDQTQKTYVSGTLKKSPPPVLPTFKRRADRALQAVCSLNEVANRKCYSTVFRASATSLPLREGSVALIATSPPYMDSVDYMYNLMLEYFWLGDVIGVPSRAKFNDQKRVAVGSKRPLDAEGMPPALDGLIDVNGFPSYRRAVVAPYFASMAAHFREAARVLRDGGRYVLVVGNSRTNGGLLPVHDALVVLASSVGLHLEHAFGYRVRRHYMKFPRKGRGGIILMDWVITLRKEASDGDRPRRLPFIDGQLPPDAVAN